MNQAFQNVIASSTILARARSCVELGSCCCVAGTAAGLNGQLRPCACRTPISSGRSGQPGICGGRLVVSQRSEPKTFNPMIAGDADSLRIIIFSMQTSSTSTAVTSKRNQPRAILDVVGRWPNVHSCPASRAAFLGRLCPSMQRTLSSAYETYLDERLHSPQRDLLLISGVPIKVRQDRQLHSCVHSSVKIRRRREDFRQNCDSPPSCPREEGEVG